jgi:hypothetical protein
MIRANDFELFREQLWLLAVESPECSLTVAQLAALVDMSPGHVSRRLSRARANRPDRQPIELIEVMAMTPMNGCSRHHEMRMGGRKICLNCGMSWPFRPPASSISVVDPHRKFKPKTPRRKKSAQSSQLSQSVADSSDS